MTTAVCLGTQMNRDCDPKVEIRRWLSGRPTTSTHKKCFSSVSNHFCSQGNIRCSCLCLCEILTDLHISITDTLSRKFSMKWSLKMSPHLKYVTTRPWEIVKTSKVRCCVHPLRRCLAVLKYELPETWRTAGRNCCDRDTSWDEAYCALLDLL